MRKGIAFVAALLIASCAHAQGIKVDREDKSVYKLPYPTSLIVEGKEVMKLTPKTAFTFTDDVDGDTVICWKGSCKRLFEVWTPSFLPWQTVLTPATMPEVQPTVPLDLCTGVNVLTGERLGCKKQ